MQKNLILVNLFVLKEGRNPLYGEVSPVYSMLKSGDIVTITSLEVVDRYSLYDSTKRLVKVKERNLVLSS